MSILPDHELGAVRTIGVVAGVLDDAAHGARFATLASTKREGDFAPVGERGLDLGERRARDERACRRLGRGGGARAGGEAGA
jgi:hypothetical protein